MSQISSVNARVTSQQLSSMLLSSLQRTQRELLNVQNQIATGKQANTPSDRPADTSSILRLHQTLDTRKQTERNLQHALSILNNVDTSLGDVNTILNEVASLASSQIGIGSDAATRTNQATVVDQQLSAIIEIANRQWQDVALFGGRNTPQNGGRVFTEFLGGIRYTGDRGNLTADVGLSNPLSFNSNGTEAFGSLSARIISDVDLDPDATAATRLAHLNGVNGRGIRLGAVELTVNGSAVSVDLSDADTLGNVVTKLNAAITDLDPAAGSFAVTADGLSLTANPGHTIAVADIGQGVTASDLGIAISATATTVAGSDVDPRLTELSTIASFSAGLDLASGLKITHGSVTKVADFSSATNLRDMMNAIERLDMGLRLEINADGTAFNLVSEVSGIELSVGENAGGSTATDLGLRSLNQSTLLADFRHGLGIQTATGEDDFQVQLHDGSTFAVNIDGLTTVGEVLTAIGNAAAGLGLTVGNPGDGGTDFNVGLALDGNGIALEDNTAGAADFVVTQLSTSHAAENLGIHTNAGNASAIAGQDNATVRVDSVFTHLINLREALLNNDESGIVFAADNLDDSVDRLTTARADIGVRTQRVEDQITRSTQLNLAEQTLLSELQDADLTSVITRLQQLQTQLQASMQVGATNLRLSFLDFLR